VYICKYYNTPIMQLRDVTEWTRTSAIGTTAPNNRAKRLPQALGRAEVALTREQRQAPEPVSEATAPSCLMHRWCGCRRHSIRGRATRPLRSFSIRESLGDP
jgi:hypothetical protein